jgi:hypothetical protein
MRDGGFERGWLPTVLQPDCTEIEETHDLDTNQVEGTFSFHESIYDRLFHQCAGTKSPDVFVCGDFTVTLDRKLRRGKFENAQR